MQAHGLALESKYTKRLTPEMLKNSTIVISMVEQPYIPDFLAKDSRVIWWNVPNPSIVTPKMREAIYQQLEDMVKKLLEKEL